MRVAVGTVAPRLLLALASVLVAKSASAEPTCITAYEQTQTLRKDGKPLASRAQAAICSRESCPALLTKDCTKWLAELDAMIPTVVFDPRTSGAPRSDVRVKIDGAPLVDKSAGRPVPLEPGSHTFVFEVDGAAPVEQTLVLKEGEKNKKVSVTIASPSSPSVDAKTSERPVPMGVWIFGGATVVALATSAVLAIDGLGKKGDLDKCKPRCAGSDVDAMSASFTLADVALGAGLMAGAAGVYLFLTRPSADPSAAPALASARARTTPFATPLSGGAVAGMAVVF